MKLLGCLYWAIAVRPPHQDATKFDESVVPNFVDTQSYRYDEEACKKKKFKEYLWEGDKFCEGMDSDSCCKKRCTADKTGCLGYATPYAKCLLMIEDHLLSMEGLHTSGCWMKLAIPPPSEYQFMAEGTLGGVLLLTEGLLHGGRSNPQGPRYCFNQVLRNKDCLHDYFVYWGKEKQNRSCGCNPKVPTKKDPNQGKLLGVKNTADRGDVYHMGGTPRFIWQGQGAVSPAYWLDGEEGFKKGMGIEACYDTVMNHKPCKKTYFHYVNGGDGNCGCVKETALDFPVKWEIGASGRDQDDVMYYENNENYDIYYITNGVKPKYHFETPGNMRGTHWLSSGETCPGPQACYELVMRKAQEGECKAEFFSIVNRIGGTPSSNPDRGDWNCGCLKGDYSVLDADGDWDDSDGNWGKSQVFRIGDAPRYQFQDSNDVVSESGGINMLMWYARNPKKCNYPEGDCLANVEECYKQVQRNPRCGREFTFVRYEVAGGDGNCGCKGRDDTSEGIAVMNGNNCTSADPNTEHKSCPFYYIFEKSK